LIILPVLPISGIRKALHPKKIESHLTTSISGDKAITGQLGLNLDIRVAVLPERVGVMITEALICSARTQAENATDS
jgi:hypothetical protein